MIFFFFTPFLHSLSSSSLPTLTHILIFLLYTIYITYTNQTPINKTLQFNANRNFTILQLTDLHYGEGDKKNLKNMNLTSYLIQLTNPDIIIITGDTVSGYMYHGQPNFFYNNWVDFVAPFIANQKLYAYAIGNHDDQGDLTREEIANLDMSNPYSLFNKSSNIDGVSNYYLPIYSYNSSNISALLWLFDSGDSGCGEIINSWGCTEQSQVEWYNQTTWALKQAYGNHTHNLAFMHIPPLEFMYLYNYLEFYGDATEPVSCPVLNTGLIDAFIQNQDITGLFVGHDHDNSFGGWWNGVELVFGRKTGHGGYGPRHGVDRGARVIILQEIIDNQTGEVINITRMHYIAYANGTLDYKQEYRTREENIGDSGSSNGGGGGGKTEYQPICGLAGSDTFSTYVLQLIMSAIIIKGVMMICQKGLLRINRTKTYVNISEEMIAVQEGEVIKVEK